MFSTFHCMTNKNNQEFPYPNLPFLRPPWQLAQVGFQKYLSCLQNCQEYQLYLQLYLLPPLPLALPQVRMRLRTGEH